MGEYTIKLWVKILAWISAVIIVALNVKLVVESIGGWVGEAENPVYLYIFVVPLAVVIGALLLYVTFGPLIQRERRHRKRSEEHTSELQSLMRISYAVFCLKKKTTEFNSAPIVRQHN